MEKKPVDDHTPSEKAWKEGRRIYVRAGYGSALSEGMRRIRANWDRDRKAWWVGTGKQDLVLPLLEEYRERVQAVQDIKALGHWVTIPYDAHQARALAKDLKALFDQDSKRWAARATEDAARIEEAVQLWQAERDAEAAAAKARRDAEKEAERARAAEEAEAAKARAEEVLRARTEKLLSESGRTPTGDMDSFTVVSTRFMNRTTAERMAYDLGDLVKLSDGRRGVVVGVKVWFTNDEMASSVCWHPETHDEAHWDLKHTVAVVEPTAEEAAEDAAKEAELRDAAELHEVMQAAGRPRESRRTSRIPVSEIAGKIEMRYGSYASSHQGGSLYLGRDDR